MRQAIETFLGGLRAAPVYGWKDPRMTLTLPIWRPHLGSYRLVACFRHPMAVARSLAEDGVRTDARGRYLRLGQAPYLSDAQLEAAIERLGDAVAALSPV